MVLENFTDREIIQRALLEVGYYKTPQEYKSYIEQEFNRKVSSSSITKTAGTYKMRVSRIEAILFDFAVKLHKVLKEDYHLNSTGEEDDPFETSRLQCLIINPDGMFGLYNLRSVQEYNKF